MMASCHLDALARSSCLFVKEGSTALFIRASALKTVLDIGGVYTKDTARI